MTHYDVDYTGLDPIEKHNKAIQDIKEYLGESRFEELTTMFREDEAITLREFQIAVSFAGVQGYPTKAWFNYCYGL